LNWHQFDILPNWLISVFLQDFLKKKEKEKAFFAGFFFFTIYNSIVPTRGDG